MNNSVSFTPVYWYQDNIYLNIVMIIGGLFVCFGSTYFLLRHYKEMFSDVKGADFNNFLSSMFGIIFGAYLVVAGFDWLFSFSL